MIVNFSVAILNFSIKKYTYKHVFVFSVNLIFIFQNFFFFFFFTITGKKKLLEILKCYI